MFRVKETATRRVYIKASMKLSVESTHKSVLGGSELVKLLKINYKSLFNQKLLSLFLELLKVMIDTYKR